MTTARFRVRAVDDASLPIARAFLERHADTSMFMLSNLSVSGPRISGALNSGDYKLVEHRGEVCAVFCLTRRTTILAESGGRTEFAQTIIDACRSEPIPIGGVIGEWMLAQALWAILRNEPDFKESYASKEVLQALNLAHIAPVERAPQVRHLRDDDFDEWNRLSTAFCAEEGLPVHGALAERKALFVQNVEAQRWWGYFEGEHLSAMAGLNAVYKQCGQVGGVYTVPARRRLGLSRSTMNAVLRDAVEVHALERLVLFTDEHNTAAQRLYDTLGFATIGDFALLMCAPMAR